MSQPLLASALLLRHLPAANPSRASGITGIKAQLPRRAKAAKGWRKKKTLSTAPPLPSPLLSSGPPHKGRCQFIRLPPATPDLWLPHNEKGSRMWKKAFKVPTVRIFLSTVSTYSAVPHHVTEPVGLEIHLPHASALRSDQGQHSVLPKSLRQQHRNHYSDH